MVNILLKFKIVVECYLNKIYSGGIYIHTYVDTEIMDSNIC